MTGLEQRVKPEILNDAKAELPTLLGTGQWYGAKIFAIPEVHRVYRPWRNGFIFLHRIYESRKRSSFHRHHGNMWVDVKEGEYEMHLARESDKMPTAYASMSVKAGDWYFMGQRDWHRIQPKTRETRSVVIVQDWVPPTILNVNGEWMTTRELQEHLDIFRAYF
jgi:hypothetical protein